MIARYLPWRFSETVATRSPLSINGAWIWFLFAIECIFIADLLKTLLVKCRRVDRSNEADIAEQRLLATPNDSWPSVDVFIPTYNEPLDVLERSIIGALGLDYPNFDVYILDDGSRDWLRVFCEKHGAVYVARSEHSHAKAGNLNHALGQSKGDLIAVFDADFVPYRNFLKRTVGLFEYPDLRIVQTPQHFFNRDPVQRNLWIADRWPDEQRLFFDHLAPSLDAWNAMFCCGSCAVLRRSAIDAIGGIPTQSITEDILTSLEMLRVGFHTRYLNERLSVGLAAETLEAFYVQRQRWCQGGIQTLFLRSGPLIGSGLNILQRILLFPIYWVFHIPARLLILLIPILYFWFGLEPLDNARGDEIMYWQVPILIAGWAASLFYFGRTAMPIINDGPATLVSLRLTPFVISTLLRPFGRPFQVTPKGSRATKSGASVFEASTLSVLIVLTLSGLAINYSGDLRIIDDDGFLGISLLWSTINIIMMAIALLMCFEDPLRRVQERFPVRFDATLKTHEGRAIPITITDLSLSGAAIEFTNSYGTVASDLVVLDIPDIDDVTARVTRRQSGEIGLDFDPEPSGQTRINLIRYLYTSGIDNAAQAGNASSLIVGLLRRLLGERPGKITKP